MPKRNVETADEKEVLEGAGSNETVDTEDPWEQLAKMQSGGGGSKDDNGFTKLNTNFFLMDGESVEIQFLKEEPFLFQAVNLKLTSKSGKPYYQTEASQLSTQKHCKLIEAGYRPSWKAAFVLVDPRGSWDSETKKLDGVPVPKIFLTPTAFGKLIKEAKDEVGQLAGIVWKLSKAGKNYAIRAVTEKLPSGEGLRYKKAPEWGGAIPDVEKIYAPSSDAYLEQILHNAAKADASSAGGKNENVLES